MDNKLLKITGAALLSAEAANDNIPQTLKALKVLRPCMTARCGSCSNSAGQQITPRAQACLRSLGLPRKYGQVR
jgi:bacterioferritin-associated ferredoxin